MVWSENWPGLRSPKFKFWDIHWVGTDALIKSWMFYVDPFKLLPLRNGKYFCMLSHLTWPSDLTWDDLGQNILWKVRNGCIKRYAKNGANSRSLRGASKRPPPPPPTITPDRRWLSIFSPSSPNDCGWCHGNHYFFRTARNKKYGVGQVIQTAK